MQKDEPYFQKEFLKFYKSHSFFRDSFISRELPLFYSADSPKRIKDEFMPYSITDFIEMDSKGNFHLWEAKMIHSDELLKGKAIGQILFYDFLFNSYPENNLKELLVANGFDVNTINNKNYDDFHFKTWNLLVCGGEGWELCGGINPVMWNYPTLPEQYFKKSVPKINLFHFYEVSTGFDLKNIWELSLNQPQNLHKEALAKYLNLDHIPNEDELEGYYLDIFMELNELSDIELDLLCDYNESANKNEFLKEKGISKKNIVEFDKKFQKSISMLEKKNELHDMKNINRFIGREWFNLNNR